MHTKFEFVHTSSQDSSSCPNTHIEPALPQAIETSLSAASIGDDGGGDGGGGDGGGKGGGGDGDGGEGGGNLNDDKSVFNEGEVANAFFSM
jgi:hypothetical protein